MELAGHEVSGGRPERLGWRVVSMVKGQCLVEWTPPEDLSNPVGMVHGGYVGVVVDDTCGTAVASMLDDFRAFPTVSMHIDFLRGIPVGGTYWCRGTVLRAGGRLTVADATITDQSDRMLARGTCTFALDLRDTSLPGFSAVEPGGRP